MIALVVSKAHAADVDKPFYTREVKEESKLNSYMVNTTK